jgi:hypothetical protein
MQTTSIETRSPRFGLLLFFLGFVAHLLLLLGVFHWWFPPPDTESSLSPAIDIAAIGLLGGISYLVFMRGVSRRAMRVDMIGAHRLFVLGAIGGLWGMLASTVALEIWLFFIAGHMVVAAGLAKQAISHPSIFVNAALLPAEVYGQILVLLFLPWGFACGTVTALLMRRLSASGTDQHEPHANLKPV